MTESDGYFCAGYFLSRWVEPEFPVDAPRHVTLARDHTPRVYFPDTWAIEWANESREERLRAATALGIGASALEDAVNQATADFGERHGAWSTIYSLDAARSYVRRFLSRTPELELWGVGLHASLRDEFLRRHGPPESPPDCAPIGPSGTYDVVARGERLRPGGTVLGHELLVHEYSCFNSPHSLHGDEAELFSRAGVRPNSTGLIDSFDDALRCCDGLRSGFRFDEPTPLDWLPWLIVTFPLEG